MSHITSRHGNMSHIGCFLCTEIVYEGIMMLMPGLGTRSPKLITQLDICQLKVLTYNCTSFSYMKHQKMSGATIIKPAHQDQRGSSSTSFVGVGMNSMHLVINASSELPPL
jgi:hypothetical protein